jgi:hypothetical protein
VGRVPEVTLSRPTLACIGLCALILAVAVIDYAHVQSEVPDIERCLRSEDTCFLTRLQKAEHLEAQYNSRAWVYTFGMLACAGVATAYALRSRPRREWLRIYTNLGVIGVWVVIALIVVLLLTSDAAVSIRAGPALTIPVVLLVIAAAGTLLGRSAGWAEESPAEGVRATAAGLGKLAVHVGTGGAAKRSRIESLGRWFAYAALGLTALAGVLTLIFAQAQPACGGAESSPPQWADPIDSVAAVAGVVAIAAGIGALVLRKWIAALISLVVNPIAFLFLLASTCAFY